MSKVIISPDGSILFGEVSRPPSSHRHFEQSVMENWFVTQPRSYLASFATMQSRSACSASCSMLLQLSQPKKTGSHHVPLLRSGDSKRMKTHSKLINLLTVLNSGYNTKISRVPWPQILFWTTTYQGTAAKSSMISHIYWTDVIWRKHQNC